MRLPPTPTMVHATTVARQENERRWPPTINALDHAVYCSNSASTTINNGHYKTMLTHHH